MRAEHTIGVIIIFLLLMDVYLEWIMVNKMSARSGIYG